MKFCWKSTDDTLGYPLVPLWFNVSGELYEEAGQLDAHGSGEEIHGLSSGTSGMVQDDDDDDLLVCHGYHNSHHAWGASLKQ
jgi:hypothetical protein